MSPGDHTATMADAPGASLTRLLHLLDVQPTAEGRYSGVCADGDGWDAVYGGHFLGQATAAACRSVEGKRLHSLHAYFLKAGKSTDPIDYDVTVVRDGRSFATRRVTASQNGGPANFELTASFCVAEDGPVIEPSTMAGFAELPDPESLPRYTELMASLDELPFPEGWALRDRGVDLRIVDAPWAPGGPSAEGGIRFWARAAGDLPDDAGVHAAIFAYLSDDSISDNLLVPFGVTWSTETAMVFSLDHAMWLHRPFRMDEWHFYDQQPVIADNARGFATARVWDRQGRLVASFTQEALVRI